MQLKTVFKSMALVMTMALTAASYAASTFNMTIDLSKINNKELSGKNFYFTFKSNKLDDKTHQYFLAFKADGTFDKFVTAEATTKSSDYSYTLAGPVVTFKNIPNCSGRMYISLNYPMYLAITKDADGNLTIADPAPGAQNDTNYLTIYDKVEFTLDGDNVVWANTTAVDFAALPMGISVGKEAIGLQVSRSKLFYDCQLAFAIGSLPDGTKVVPSTISKDWSSCILTTTVNDKVAYLRIAAPNQSATFNTKYLDDYIKQIWAYYQKKDMKISIDCSELAGDKAASAATRNSVSANPIFVGSVTKDNYWTFTNDNGKIDKKLVTTVDMIDKNSPINTSGIPTSNEVFGAANEGPFSGDNHTIKSVITKFLLSGVVSGILPAKGNPTLNTAYYTANKVYLFKTSDLVTPTGSCCPWYDLYSAVLHKFGYKIYAFAYDDAMGMDSTVHANAPATVTCTMGDLAGIVIPANSHNATSYKVSFGVPKGATLKIQYEGKFYDWVIGKGILVNGKTLDNPVVPASLNIQYGSGTNLKPYTLDLNIPSNSTLPGCDIHSQGDGKYIGLPAL